MFLDGNVSRFSGYFRSGCEVDSGLVVFEDDGGFVRLYRVGVAGA